VLEDADLGSAVEACVSSRLINGGQSCIAAKRFIVHRDVFHAFSERFANSMRALKIGDPMEDGVDIGPLALEQGVRDVEELVDEAVAKGATIVCGGERPSGPGWFYPPTIVSGITPDMRIFHEEVFGPVASLYEVNDIDEAIDLANATVFGLGSNAWTRDPDERARFVRDIDAGAVFVNGMTTSYPELPFGGVKQSGYGRELSAHGIHEFCNIKTVWVKE
jgi:succinate-semialdehyde dehydrogenase/glutarate-semialdehyde dehydrogenase